MFWWRTPLKPGFGNNFFVIDTWSALLKFEMNWENVTVPVEFQLFWYAQNSTFDHEKDCFKVQQPVELPLWCQAQS